MSPCSRELSFPCSFTWKNRFINIIRDPEVKECPQLKIVRIDGSLYFGALEVVSEYFSNLFEKGEIKHVLIIAKGINFVDLAGATWLANEAEKWQKNGGGMYISGLKIVSQEILKKGGFRKEIGEGNFYNDKRTAIKDIFGKLDKNICKNCKVRIFHEC
jgi:SulP family sulfate permease